MADVKGQVDWGLLVARTIQAHEQGQLSPWLRTTFEPLVKAAEEMLSAPALGIGKKITTEFRDGVLALRAALHRLPKVGG